MTAPTAGSSRVRVRAMSSGDLALADELRQAASWNQTLEDWKRFFACEPDGCFIAECGGIPAGTATITCYGTDLGWIGMLLVHPAFRRLGIGSTLLQHCLNELQHRGVRSVKLDATPMGQPIYERFGFRPELKLARWEHSAVNPRAEKKSDQIEPCTGVDFNEMAELDACAFGVGREKLLRLLLRQSLAAVVCRSKEEQGKLLGFGMVRPGARTAYLGPVVALTPEAGARIVETLLAHIRGTSVFWDVLEPNSCASALVRELGFTQQRALLRMFRGENHLRPKPELQFALADPAVG